MIDIILSSSLSFNGDRFGNSITMLIFFNLKGVRTNFNIERVSNQLQPVFPSNLQVIKEFSEFHIIIIQYC